MNLGWHIVPLSDLSDRIRAAGPGVSGAPDPGGFGDPSDRAGSPRRLTLIAIDGHGSSGKTTLSHRLQAILPHSAVLHTDDLAWHQGVFAWDRLLVEDVLPVVRAGDPLHYRPPQWRARDRAGAIELPGGLRYLLLEGVGASQASIRSELDLAIWVETDEPTRAARTRARVAAGETSTQGYYDWMVEENAYVVENDPWLDVDLLVEGGDSIHHDRDTEIVLGRLS